LIVSCVIFASIALVVHESDQKASGEEISTSLAYTSTCILFFYIAELTFRIYAYGWLFFRKPENLFDMGVVVSDSMLELLEVLGATLVSGLGVLRIFRALRVLRVLRLSSAVSMLSELYLMLHGLFNSIRALIWAAVLMIIVLAVWSIVAVDILHPLNVELIKEGAYPPSCVRCREAYQSVGRAIITFIQTTISGDSWGEVAVPMITKHPWTGLVYFAVIVTVQLGLLNLILAVIVDRAMEARKEDEDQMLKTQEDVARRAERRLQKLCESIDTSGNGILTQEDLRDAFQNNYSFVKAVRTLGIHEEDLEQLFNILDSDESGDIDVSEFVEKLHQIKTAEVRTLSVFIRHFTEKTLPKQLAALQSEVQECRYDLKKIAKVICKTSDNVKFMRQSVSMPDMGDSDNSFSPVREAKQRKAVSISEKTDCIGSVDSADMLSMETEGITEPQASGASPHTAQVHLDTDGHAGKSAFAKKLLSTPLLRVSKQDHVGCMMKIQEDIETALRALKSDEHIENALHQLKARLEEDMTQTIIHVKGVRAQAIQQLSQMRVCQQKAGIGGENEQDGYSKGEVSLPEAPEGSLSAVRLMNMCVCDGRNGDSVAKSLPLISVNQMPAVSDSGFLPFGSLLPRSL